LEQPFAKIASKNRPARLMLDIGAERSPFFQFLWPLSISRAKAFYGGMLPGQS
jgi:hypothetical protein